MDNPHKLSKTIFEALEVVGKRAVIQRGWGKLGEVPGVPVRLLLTTAFWLLSESWNVSAANYSQ